MAIYFDSTEVDLPVLDYDKIRAWIDSVASGHGVKVGRLSYLFCNDDYILKANNQFLGHDYYTDIITFDYSAGERISGDIIISLDTVRSNARLLDEPYIRELYRVIIHGVLHLCGIDDKGPGEREVMEREENKALSLLS